MTDQYVFETDLGLSNFALILAMHLSFDSLIKLDCFFKDSVINLLIHSRVSKSFFKKFYGE